MRLTQLPPARALPLPFYQIVKTGFHDVVGYKRWGCDLYAASTGFAAYAKTFAQGRPSPSDAPGLCQNGTLKSREIADANEAQALIDRLGHGFVANAGQNAAQAIATARDQRDIGSTGTSPVNGRQPGLVVPGKAQMTGQRGLVNFNLMTQGFKPRHAAFESRLVAYGARRRIDIDVFVHNEFD